MCYNPMYSPNIVGHVEHEKERIKHEKHSQRGLSGSGVCTTARSNDTSCTDALLMYYLASNMGNNVSSCESDSFVSSASPGDSGGWSSGGDYGGCGGGDCGGW